MAKVIKAFKERYHNFKKYETGDNYPETDIDRVAFLVKEGYLQKPKPKNNKKGAGKDVNA